MPDKTCPPVPPAPKPCATTPPPNSRCDDDNQTPPRPDPTVFTLDLAAPTNDVTLTIQAPARIPVKIIRSGGPVGGNIALDVSSFATDQGALTPVTLSVGGTADAGRTHLDDIPFTGPMLAADLHVPELLPGGKYTGRLILTPPAGTPVVWPFTVTAATAPHPATVVLDQNAVTVTTVRCLPWWPCAAPTVTVHARDKTGNAPLVGLVARLEPGLKSDGLALDRQLSVTLDGRTVPDFFAAPGSGERNVVAGGQATITLTFADFEPGEHTLPLRITAKNSGDDDLQRLTVTVQVRNSLWLAIAVLIVAALLSYAATRLVTALRQRGQFLMRVSAMQTGWLANEPPLLPVIWLRAALRQARRLSSRFWLTGQDKIEERITGAAGMLSVLDRIRQVRQSIDALPNPKVRLRATWKLDKVIARIPAAPLTDADVSAFKEDLASFDDWLMPDPKRLETAFWADLEPAVRALLAQVQVVDAPGTAARELTRQWCEKLRGAPPADLDGGIELQDAYERLAILWEARDHPDWIDQIAALPATCPIEQVYKVIDDGWWRELTALGPDRCRIVTPSSSLDPVEALQTFVLEFRTDAHPTLFGSYLVQKKLTYTWTIDIYARGDEDSRRAEPALRLTVETTQPRVAQYSPIAGTVRASVKITYNGRQGPTVEMKSPIPVRASRDFGILRIFATADMVAFAAALLASVVSGIALYALAPTFGSLKDYIALFTWAASFDQGKNFLQSLAASSGPAPAATPPTTRSPTTPPASPPSPDAAANSAVGATEAAGR